MDYPLLGHPISSYFKPLLVVEGLCSPCYGCASVRDVAALLVERHDTVLLTDEDCAVLWSDQVSVCDEIGVVVERDSSLSCVCLSVGWLEAGCVEEALLVLWEVGVYSRYALYWGDEELLVPGFGGGQSQQGVDDGQGPVHLSTEPTVEIVSDHVNVVVANVGCTQLSVCLNCLRNGLVPRWVVKVVELCSTISCGGQVNHSIVPVVSQVCKMPSLGLADPVEHPEPYVRRRVHQPSVTDDNSWATSVLC